MLVFRLIGYFAGFGLARGSLFLAPILLANMVSSQAYGILELSQATGALFALLLGCGLQGTVPLVLLRGEVKARWDTLLWFLSRGAGICFGFSFFGLLFSTNALSVAVLFPLFTGVLILQGLWSMALKSRGRATAAVFLEAGFWSFAVVGAGLVVLTDSEEGFLLSGIFLYSAILFAVTIFVERKLHCEFKLKDLMNNIELGMPLMFSTLLALGVTSSGRFILGAVSGVEAVGIYSVLYRVTALPLVGHQLLIIGFFRRLFTWDEKTLQLRAPIIIFGVSGCVLVFELCVGTFGWLFGNKFTEVFGAYPVVARVLLVQTILWSAIALNDLLVSRLLIAALVAKKTAVYLILGIPTLVAVAYLNKDSMRIYVCSHGILMVGYYITQCYAVHRNGHMFVRLWTSVITCLVVCLIVLLLPHTSKY